MKFEELWVIRGNQPVLWTIPVWLHWDPSQHEGTLYCSVDLMPFMLDALNGVLRGCSRPFNGMWQMLREDLERIAYQINPPVNPNLYLSWERRKEYQKPQHDPEKFVDLNDFLDAMYQRGIGKSRDECAWWWRQFCNHMLDWLVMKEKTVDLGFMKLHPTMYRKNWREILLGRFPKLGMGTSNLNDVELHYILRKTGFIEALLSPDMLAMNRQLNYFYRGVEIEFSKSWHRAIRDVEVARRRRLTVATYSSQTMDSVRRFLPTMLRLYRQWLAHIARPTAQAVPHPLKHLTRLVPNLPRALRPEYRQANTAYPVVPNKLPACTPSSLESDIFAPVAEVPIVPDLQPPAAHLREHRRDVEGPEDWQI